MRDEIIDAPDFGMLKITFDQPGESVVAESVLATPEGFLLLLLNQRPDGVVLVCVPLGADGTVGASRTLNLRYPPAVAPMYDLVDGVLVSWGITARTPTLVVQREVRTDEEEGLDLLHSQRVPTARGFLGRHQPVLACKGGVAMPVGLHGAGDPARTLPRLARDEIVAGLRRAGAVR